MESCYLDTRRPFFYMKGTFLVSEEWCHMAMKKKAFRSQPVIFRKQVEFCNENNVMCYPER